MKLHAFVVALVAVIALTFFAACKKEDTTHPDVTVDSPLDGTWFDAGATVAISGTVTDETALKEATIEVTTGANDSIVFTQTTNVSGKSATVTASYVVNLSSGKPFQVHLEATDQAGNSYEEHTHLKVN